MGLHPHDWNTAAQIVIAMFILMGLLTLGFAALCYALIHPSLLTGSSMSRYWREILEIADDAWKNGTSMVWFGGALAGLYLLVHLVLHVLRALS